MTDRRHTPCFRYELLAGDDTCFDCPLPDCTNAEFTPGCPHPDSQWGRCGEVDAAIEAIALDGHLTEREGT